MRGYLVGASSNSEYDSEDKAYALVDIDATFVARLLRIKHEFKATKGKVPEMQLWKLAGSNATFASRRAIDSLFGEDLVEDFSNGDDPIPVEYDLAKIEKYDPLHADELCIFTDGFWWEAGEKHTSIIRSSDFFPWAWVDQCVYCGMKKQEHSKKKCLFSSTTYKAVV